MDQFGKGATVFLHKLFWSPTCPVRVLRSYIGLRRGGSGPLLDCSSPGFSLCRCYTARIPFALGRLPTPSGGV